MDRLEHIQWCKDRALEYLDNGETNNAITSMGSDLNKHPETKDHAGIQLALMLMLGGKLSTQDEVRKFINGFN